MSREPTPEPVPLLAVDTDDGLQPRQCARCRQLFEADPTVDALARNDWWLCPPCEAALLPGRTPNPSSNVIPFRRPGPGR